MKKLHHAVTLIEVLVAIGIIAILIAILLPAIQYAREAARQTQCRNHLHQFGIAIHAYEASQSCFPPCGVGYGHSFLALLLPHLEQKDLYDSINFQAPPSSLGARLTPAPLEANTTARSQQPELFLCPSDAGERLGSKSDPAFTNYAGVFNAWPKRGTGFFGAFRGDKISAIRAVDVTAGLSSTVAMSEFLIGVELGTRKPPIRVIWNIGGPWERIAEECDSLDPSSADFSGTIKGHDWMVFGKGTQLYDHVLTPNRYSCWGARSAVTASSMHSGGVNALFADGSVHFVRETIDRGVWQAIGDRERSFPVSSSEF